MGNAKVYIYGIIDSNQDQNPEEWGYINLTSVRKQVISQGEFEEVDVHIHSEGGVVTEGFAIHDYLRSLGKPINCYIDGVCASIATIVLLAGDKRIGSENSAPLIHNPWGMIGGEKKDIQKYADELESLEDKISDFYSAKTNISKEEALEFMKVETSFTADESLINGFLTEIKSVMRAVALYSPKKIIMAKEELTEEKVQGMLDATWTKIKNALSIKDAPINKIVQDANGVEIYFTDVADDGQEVVGDKATIDGTAADGEVVMPSGEVYVFASGELTEIKPKEEDDEDEALATANAEIERLKGELSEAQASIVNLKDDVKAEKEKKKEYKNSLKDVSKDVNEIKKALGSDFKWDSEKKNYSKSESGTRSVLKSKKED